MNFRFADHAHLAHVNYFTQQSLIRLLAEFGFEPIARLYSKTAHYGDVHLGILFRKTSRNFDLPPVDESQKPDAAMLNRRSPVYGLRKQSVLIVTDSVRRSITDFENYTVDEFSSEKCSFRLVPGARSRISVLVAKALADPVGVWAGLKRKFLWRVCPDRRFSDFKYTVFTHGKH